MSLSLMRVLTTSEIECIHERSLDLLERVGIAYNAPAALEVLRGHGCPVDEERNRACLPRELVDWCLEQAPRKVRLPARDPNQDVVLNGNRSHHTTSSQAARTRERRTGRIRPSTAEDLKQGLLLADALDMVHIVNVMVAATDVPSHMRTLRHFELAFSNTGKHVRTGVLHASQVPYILELAHAAAGSGEFRPIFSLVYCPISPLMHDGDNAEAAIELAKVGVPMLVYPMAMAGATAPATPLGCILQYNVEVLSALVLFQLVNPGAPVIYGTGAVQMDMHSGQMRDNARADVMRLALAEMARFYHLPVNLGGLGTASEKLDAQYAFEATATCLLSYLAGADEIYSMGLLASAQFLSLKKLVLDDHLARELELMIRPLEWDDTTLLGELIERVGIGGHYLNQPETRRYIRHQYLPVWPPAGQDMLRIAEREMEEIIASHRPPPLPQGAPEEMARIMAEAEKGLGGA
jgi:trimethylamine--corrinoid protein Co-methyltransferase